MQRSRLYRAMLLVVLGAALSAQSAAAQFAAGQKYLGAHVGLSGVGSTAAIGVSGEVAFNDRIAFGAWGDTWSYGESYATGIGEFGWDVRYIALAGTGSYHFPIASTPKLDPFLGVALGYFVVSSKASGVGGVEYSGDASRVFAGGFGGARYYFRESMSGVARVGFGAAYLTVGVDFKL
jgi:outer membrane protein W